MNKFFSHITWYINYTSYCRAINSIYYDHFNFL